MRKIQINSENVKIMIFDQYKLWHILQMLTFILYVFILQQTGKHDTKKQDFRCGFKRHFRCEYKV